MRILVPLDGSELAELALQTAVALARKLGGEILAVRVVKPIVAALAGTPEFGPSLNEAENEEAEAYLAGLDLPGVTVTRKVLFGQPVEQILAAQSLGGKPADLVVMSSHGRSGPGRWLLGSVAERVLRQSACPVLLHRGQVSAPPDGFRRVLVPVDGSPEAGAVLGRLEPYLAPDARVTLLRASDSAPPSSERYLEALREELRKLDPAGKLAHRVVDGHPAESILALAQELSADLIAMATHGRSGLHRFLVGSTTERVARHSDCPVLAFPPP